MQRIMDRLMASLTEIDNLIRRQRRAIATVAAVENLNKLESSRKHIRQAQFELVSIEGDALPGEASAMQSETPVQTPGQHGP